jgi:polysaccharide biosynthesis protein PslH
MPMSSEIKRKMEASKKILFLSNRGLLPIKDGHTRRSYNILKGLAENNQIYFLSLFEAPEEVCTENIEKLKQICSHVEFLPAPPKKISVGMIVRLVRSLFSLDPYTIWRHYSTSFLNRVEQLIDSKQFDLVHCDTLPICYSVRNGKNVLRSVTDHDVSYLKCLSMARDKKNILLKLFMHIEAWKLRRLEGTIFKQVDLGIVVSQPDGDVLRKLCPEGQFLVVENGVALESFYPSGETTEQSKIVWMGGFDHYPNRQGINFFLEKVYPLVKQEIPDVSVDIIGGGLTDTLRRYAAKDSSVNFTGYVDDPLPYISRASVFVAPVLSGGGTKLKVLEAMAAGKAIVTTSVGCEGIGGTPGIHYLVADEHSLFAKDIVRIINDHLLKESLGMNAKNLVTAKYDFVKLCRKLDGHYSEMLENHNRCKLTTRCFSGSDKT